MGISSVASMNSMSGIQAITARSTDVKNKNIQKEITEVQQQMRELSSKEELSVNEKANEKKKLQKEISSLNTELRQHQDELSKSQKREIRMAQLQEEKEPAKEGKAESKNQAENAASGKTDETKESVSKEAAASGSAGNTGASRNEAPANGLSSDSAQQAGRIISKSKDGIVILKGVMNQDENRSVDTEKKLTEESSPAKADEDKEKVGADKEAKTSNSDTKAGLSGKEIHAIVSADNSAKQVSRQETVIANISEGIVILKGEISQDERRGIDTEQKEAELDKMEKREEMARTIQSSVLGNANQAMKSAVKAQTPGTKNEPQTNAENNTLRIFQNEEQESEHRFYVSLGI